MTTWTPRDAGHEVLSYGNDRPPRRPPAVLIGVAAVSLAVGFLVGDRVGIPLGRSEADDAAVTRIAAGPVRKLGDAVDDTRFAVPVFNSGDEAVQARVVALPGWSPELTRTMWARVAPNGWTVLRFSAPANCTIYPGRVRIVHVRVEGGEGVQQRLVPLPEPADVLESYHNGVCAPRFVPDREALSGVWLVEAGRTGFPSGVMMMRFGLDGTFALDPAGGLYSPRPWLRGSYDLADEDLAIVAKAGEGCGRGARLDWKAGVLPDGRLHLRHDNDAGGACRIPSGVWLARRVLDAEAPSR